MSTEWTPTTEGVRAQYMHEEPSRSLYTVVELRSEFDRWLAAHDAEVRKPLEAEVEHQKRLSTLRADALSTALDQVDSLTHRAVAAEAKVRAVLEVSAAQLVMTCQGTPEWRDGYAAGVAALAQAQDDAVVALADPTREGDA